MAYNETPTITWNRSTPRDGLLFAAEFARIYDAIANYIVANGGSAPPRTMTAMSVLLDGTVNLTGNQTIAGTKTFSSVPVSGQAPTIDSHLTRKDYVDALIVSHEETAREKFVRINGGQWFDLIWKDADEVTLKCKAGGGFTPFVGAILPNTGTFLYSETDIIIKYDTPANSGHIIDGITAKLANGILNLWLYENSGGTLAAALTHAPSTTVNNANPTDEITLDQVNSQDIGYLFPVGAGLMIFQDTDEWEGIYAVQNAAAITYDPTKNKPVVASRTATVLTLGANLENTNFSASSSIYQVNGFKPLQVSDGAIASVIGARGYKDTGIRFPTDDSGNIINFVCDGKTFLFSNGTGAADIYGGSTNGWDYVATTNAWVNYLFVHCPADKKALCQTWCPSGSNFFAKRYYEAYGNCVASVSNSNAILCSDSYVLHKIGSFKWLTASSGIWMSGYEI